MSDITKLLVLEQAEQASWPREPQTMFRMWTGDPRNESADTSGGDAGGGDAGGADTGGGADAGGAGAGGGDFGKLFDAFETFRGDVTTRFDGLEQRIPVADDAGDDGDDGDDGTGESTDFFDPRNFSDEDFDERGMLTREAQQRGLRAMMEQTYAELRAPELAAQAEERRTSEANALEQRHPVFADPQKRAPILAAAQELAGRMARATGNSSLRDAWREPTFLETVYLGQVGRQAVAGETRPGQGQDVTLERGGSAGPAGEGEDGSKAVAKGIVALANKSKFRLGTG